MRRAREHGKRLSDVVEATWTHLKQATWPRAYLTRLISQPVDFRRQTQLRTAEAGAREAQDTEAVELDRILASAAGRTWIDVGLTTRFVVSTDAQSLVAVRADEGIERTMPASQMRGFARAIHEGRVRLAQAGELQALVATQGTPETPSSDAAPRPSLAAIVRTAAALAGTRVRAATQASGTYRVTQP